MKTTLLITVFYLLFSIQLHAQEINKNYDEALAKELKRVIK